jgi:hypothetical protein
MLHCPYLKLTELRFSLKFQKIVQQEKNDNFISRLHGGKLDIMPWPVIESMEFYKLFATLKARLDQQTFSHSTAGEFLHTIKTLMAKLKVCHFFLLIRRFVTLLSDKRLGNAFPYVISSFLISTSSLPFQQKPWQSTAPDHSPPSSRSLWLQVILRSSLTLNL